MKNPTLATVLNIIPGLGYIYLGGDKSLVGKILIVGIVLIVLSGFDPTLTAQASLDKDFTTWDTIAIFGVFSVIGALMYDAYLIALTHNIAQGHFKKA